MSSIFIVYGTGILIGVLLSLFIAGGVPSRRTREKAGIYVKSYGRYYMIHSYVLGTIILAMGFIVMVAAAAAQLAQLTVGGITVASLGIGMMLGDLPNLISDALFRIRKRY